MYILHLLARVNLAAAFIGLWLAHMLLYYLLENEQWFPLSLLAALIDTGVIAAIQYAVQGKTKNR